MRKRLPDFVVFALIALIAFPYAGHAQNDGVLQFREQDIRAILKDNSTVVVLRFGANGVSENIIRAHVSLAWLDTNDGELSKTDAAVTITPNKDSFGRSIADIEIPFSLVKPSIWTRLKYSITPEATDAAAVQRLSPVRGIVSLSQIADHAFELKASQIGSVWRSDGHFSVFVEAIRARDRAPVHGITWDAKLSFSDKVLKTTQIIEHSEGFTEFVFDFPEETVESDTDDINGKTWEDVNITGWLGDFIQNVELEVTIYSRVSVRVQTDKPVYQPGQTIHMRAVLLNQTGHAAGNEKVTLRITNNTGEEVHVAELVSSSFGIIHDDWLIPENAQSGNYGISFTLQGRDENVYERHIVRVSRYELPTFSVDVKTNRNAYLPGEQSVVTVTGAYLFGKPVPYGKVKIARMNNYSRYYDDDDDDDEEEIVAEGVADENGVFTAGIDLRKEYKNFSEYRSQFKDLTFAAYYNDITSGRTEQRRFDIRITNQPIHIYYSVNRDGGTLPAPLYINACYADGNPVSASLEIMFRNRTIKARTDSNGVAKVLLPGSEDDDSRFYEALEINATDDAGQIGTIKTTNFWPGNLPFRIETDRTIYRSGETVTLRVISPEEMPPDQTVVVHALSEIFTNYDGRYSGRNARNIASRVVQLEGREGVTTFPWRSEFQRIVTFTVWNKSADGWDDFLGAKTVVFPSDTELQIHATPDRAEYKPGEDAALSVQVTSSDGHPVEAALGVAIVDQAVLERARTDTEFGGRTWFNQDITAEPEINGVRLSDLFTLKPEKSVTPELDLLAEALVTSSELILAEFESSESETLSLAPRFTAITSQMKNLEAEMKDKMPELGDFWDAEDMANMLLGSKPSGFDLRDPWGTPYHIESEYFGTKHTISVWSNGPDKRKGGSDDFRVLSINRDYFLQTKQFIQGALGKNDFPATVAEFFEILHENGYVPDAIWDPWGTKCEVNISTYNTRRTISIRSAGPDHKSGTADDVLMAEFSGGYFSKENTRIWEALEKASSKPQTVDEFREILNSAGVDLSRVMDAWGRPYKIVRRIHEYPVFENTKTYGQSEWSKTSVSIPHLEFSIRSNGANLNDTGDNFDVALFSFTIENESPISGISRDVRSEKISQTANLPVEMSSEQSGSAYLWNCDFIPCGRIVGTVTDMSGAVIPGASVTAINDDTGVEIKATTNAVGVFYILSLPEGTYILRTTTPGFTPANITDIRISGGQEFRINVELYVSSTFTEIQVVGGVTESMILESGSSTGTIINDESSGYTPRVREYFPETLLWIPELITGKNGAAATQVKLADAITTWKLAVFASTKDGRIAETESDFRTLQPFFLDFNPPQNLTAGDEVTLPVTARNYLEKSQTAKIRVVPNNWSEILDGGTQTIDVPDGGSVNAAFTLRARRANEKAAQRIIAETGTAGGSGRADAGRNGDAIEKTLRVHPDGQEVVQTYGDMNAGAISFDISIPKDAIRDVTRGELKIYPNIASMLFESVSAMLEKPTGCGEQTTSGGYANLIALRFARSVGINDGRIEKTALDNISRAVERLKGFSKDDGGGRLYPHYEPDAALTAYMLGFLVEAAEFVPVREKDISLKISWLEKHKNEWMPRDVKTWNMSRVTSIANALSAANRKGFKVQDDVLGDMYDYLLSDSADLRNEPYALANFILTAMDSGDERRLQAAVAQLASMARDERSGVYWRLNDSSPFYGWGSSGNYEVTGLAISALSGWRASHPESTDSSVNDEALSADALDFLIRRGTLFLLRGRERDGYWHSTQATLQTMRAVADAATVLGGLGNPDGRFEIRIHGKLVQTITVDSIMRDPVVIDVSGFLTTGDNPVTITPSKEGATAVILFSSSYWLPWEKTEARVSPELLLHVQFEKTEIGVGEQTRCFVRVERTGYRSRGMMIASIGLPPGAEPDRASLEALISSGSGVDRYEVMPDRVIFYLWPSSGVSTFQFRLSARFPMKAKSEPSVLYDYYNPEALSEVPPFRWIVK